MTREDGEADFIIVGSGAGGATAARVLSEAGFAVTVCEEGPWIRAHERPRALLDAMTAATRDAGAQATASSAPIPVLQGRLVGGSTAINSGIIWRLPDDVREHWASCFGLAALVDANELDRIFARIEAETGVTETAPELLGGNGLLMARGAERLGLPGRAMRRNAANCKGSARCLQGCPNAARQSMDTSYIPAAVARGAEVLPLHRARRVLVARGRAVGVEGVREGGEGRTTFRLRARLGVILSAGVVHTPLLLRSAGIRGIVGQHFQAHPGAAVLGRFDEDVAMGHGATQAYEIPQRSRGFKLESLSLPPELLAARIPGAGAEWQERLAHLNQFAQWCTQVRMEAHGAITPSLFGRPVIRYEPTGRDVARVMDSVVLLSELMFAAGAREVYPGVARLPAVLRSMDEVRVLREAKVERRDLHLLASHLFGTARAGTDPRTSVVDGRLEAHAVRGLHVLDASVFPTNLGVNPQHSIMAVAWRAAEWLAEAAASRAA